MTRERAGTDRGAGSEPDAKVVTGQLHRVRRGGKKRFVPEPPPQAEQRPARVAMQLALAHAVQRAIDAGELRDQADAARRLGLTRARLTQLMDLALLAPEIQERLLFLEVSGGVHLLSERRLRAASAAPSWEGQRRILSCTPTQPAPVALLSQ